MNLLFFDQFGRQSGALVITVMMSTTIAQAQGTAWNLNAGNNNATSTSYVGTTNNIDLSLRTVGAQRLLISGVGTTAGNVGIGTFTNSQVTGKLNVKTGWSDWMEFHTTANTRWNFHNPQLQDAFLMSYTNSSNVTTYDYFNVKTNGNVGFGTHPSIMNARVNIKQGWSDWLELHRTADAGYWHIHNPSEQNRIIWWFTQAGGGQGQDITFWNSGKLSLGVDPAKVTGSYNLYVANGILTEKVKVALTTSADWADHVLAPDYSLMPLATVRAFIEANCHLPGVPSADEMVEEGVDMVKTDAMLMAKVEELTLYILQLEARIAQLEKQ